MIRLICEKTVSKRHNERDLKASIRELATALESGLDDHLTPAKLQDFLAGDLPEPERERVEEHLALCRECARATLELAEPLEPVRRGALLTESELEAQWGRFRARVAPAPWWQKKGWALAAVLLLTVLGVWGLRESQKPQPHVYLVDLDPVAQLRSTEKPVQVHLPAWAGRIFLNLYLESPSLASEYRVDILTEDGRPIWSQSGVPHQEEGVAVEISARLLPEGTYRIRLTAPQGEPVEYVVRIKTSNDR